MHDLFFRAMSQLSGTISQSGKEIHKVELSVDGSGDLRSLVSQLRELQKNTNEFLTGLINEGSSDANGELIDDIDGESDEEVPEPAIKVSKLN